MRPKQGLSRYLGLDTAFAHLDLEERCHGRRNSRILLGKFSAWMILGLSFFAFMGK